MTNNIIKKSFTLIFVLFIFAVTLNINNQTYAFTGNATLTLNNNSITVSASNVDPIVIKAGEQGAGNLVITEFNMDISSNLMPIVYTTKWPYKETPARPGAYEYSFKRTNQTYELIEIKQNGGIEIPINGVVVSIKDTTWQTASVGQQLTHQNFSLPQYAGAVEITGSGLFAGTPNKNIRIAIDGQNRRRNGGEVIYYNNQWGKNTGQNEFGAEAKFTLNDQGDFEITEIRDLRDTKQLEIGAKDFIISIHGEGSSTRDYRSLLANQLFVKVGDKASLVGTDFVNLSKTSQSTITSFNPTGPIKPTDVDELNQNKYFPGFRAANYLMFYDNNYTKTSNGLTNHYPNYTGANEWGYEVLVKITDTVGDEIYGEVESSAKQIDNLPGDSYFILSGNGTAEAFLIQNSLAGSLVIVNKTTKSVVVSSTLQSYISTVSYRSLVVNEMMQTAVDAKYKLNHIRETDSVTDNMWTRAKAEIEATIGTPTDQSNTSLYGIKYLIDNFTGTEKEKNVLLADFNYLFLQGLKLAYQIESMSYTNLAISSIGVWHRPNRTLETNLAGIKQTIETFVKAGVNTVYLETFWNGYSMSSDSLFVDYHKDFIGNTYGTYKDYLDAFVTEAHQAGIEVHAWVENFFVGYQDFAESNILTGQLPNSNDLAPDAIDRASWVIRDYQNNDYTQFEGGKYKFIDPSNPAVRNFLTSFYEELLTNYDLDGINLDYIRYPVSNGYTGNVPFDHGYSEFAAKKFLAEQGFTEANQTLANLKNQLNLSTNFEAAAKALKSEWDKFKVRQVSEFVKEVYDMVESLEAERVANTNQFSNEQIIISTAVFAGTDALEKKYQDWESWVKDGLIDVTTPMVYYTNSDTVTLRLREMINKITNNAYNYAGIAPYFMGLDPIQEVYQVVASQKGNAFGTVIFDSKTIINSEDALNYLSNGVSGHQTIIPHLEPTKLINAFIDEMMSRSDLYEITGNKLQTYENYLNTLKTFNVYNRQGMLNLLRNILAFQDDLSLMASGHSITRINEELTNLYNILNVRYQRMIKGFIEEKEDEVVVEKTNLLTKISAVEALDSTLYTEASWSALSAQLVNAQAVYDNETATQTEVDNALNNLEAAFNQLELLNTEVEEPSTPNNTFVLVAAGLGVLAVLSGISVVLILKKRK